MQNNSIGPNRCALPYSYRPEDRSARSYENIILYNGNLGKIATSTNNRVWKYRASLANNCVIMNDDALTSMRERCADAYTASVRDGGRIYHSYVRLDEFWQYGYASVIQLAAHCI